MRSDPVAFALQNESQAKRPRFVIEIEFDVESIYMTSHTGISGVPGIVMENVLRKPSGVSQRIVPDEGRSEIGSFNFSLVDLNSIFTEEIRDKLGDGKGLRGKKVRFWVGYARFAPPEGGGFGSGGFGEGGFGEGAEGTPGPESVFSEFQLFQTQIITGVSYDQGLYDIKCADITREQRENIFEPKTTTLRDTLAVGATTVAVYSTVGFQPVYHGPSYSDGPNGVYGYVKVDDEWVRYTGLTADSFTGCTRGVLNTKEVEHAVDAASDADRRPKVTEGIYLELPAVKLAHAVLTGIIHGTSPTQTLPPHWHLGIDPDLVRLSDFTGIGTDLWDTSLDTSGFVVRFQGLSKIDGKKFLETEIYMLLGCYSPIYSDGTIGLKRMNQVLADSAYVTVLDSRNIVSHGALEHDMSSLHNRLQIDWNWNGEEFTRTTLFVDATSVATNGSAPLKKMQFKGLHGSRHTEAIIRKRLDAFRDRYTSVPETTTVDVLSSLNRLEVGDIVRDRMRHVRDYAGATQDIDRSFEIQRRSVDYITGDVTLELFGSTAPASSESPNDTGSDHALPDAFYNSAGTELSTVCTIVVVGGVGVIQAGTYNLVAGIYYYLGDLELSDGATLTINGTVQIRVRGFFTINGDIDGVGRGKAGVADASGFGTTAAGTPGFLGNSRGMDGVHGEVPRFPVVQTQPCAFTAGQYAAFPYLELVVSGNDLLGIPSDLAGTSGGAGGKITRVDSVAANGGTGADSGAGLCIVCRGLACGASAMIDLSGDDSASTSISPSGLGFTFAVYPGPGGAGCPGAFLILLDGSSIFIPDIGGKFVAACGAVPVDGTALPEKGRLALGTAKLGGWAEPGNGYLDESMISNLDLSNVAYRIQYIPQEETPQEDVSLRAPYNLQLFRQFNDRVLTWTPPPNGTYDSVEIFASITNNRPDALQIGEVAGSSFVYTPPPSLRGLLYYWIRSTAGPYFSEWFPLSATSGISQDSALPDPQRIVPDPEFSLSTTLGAYWVPVFYSASPGATFEILSSGGVAGGLGRYVMTGSDGNNLELYARRIPAMQATTGQVVEVTARWRRTTSITNPLTEIAVFAGLATTEEPNIGAMLSAALISASGTDREDDLNSFSINQWQEIRAVFRLQNMPKSQSQRPYLRVGIVFDPWPGETGTIEIDRVDAIFGTII